MTVERRLVVGLGDIRSIILECNKCKARMSANPEAFYGIPEKCSFCNDIWWLRGEASPFQQSGKGTAEALINSMRTMRTILQEKKDTFKILFEFDEPKGAQ